MSDAAELTVRLVDSGIPSEGGMGAAQRCPCRRLSSGGRAESLELTRNQDRGRRLLQRLVQPARLHHRLRPARIGP
jgi:hypothetical protein